MDEQQPTPPAATLIRPSALEGRAHAHASAPRAKLASEPDSTAREPLAEGTPAPDFSLACGPSQITQLADFRGAPLVLVFYVADWHPVCTEQLTLYRELLPEIRALGADLVAISTDSPWSHGAFAREHRLGFRLLADYLPRGETSRRYGVYARGTGAARRAIFIVDANGLIHWRAVFPTAVNPGADGIFTSLETLQAASGGAISTSS